MKHLSSNQIEKIQIALPEEGELQELISNIKERTKHLEQQIALILHEISTVQEFRTRLIADVVTGKLDVRAAAANLPALAEDEPADAITDEDDLEEVADAFEDEEVAA